MAVVMDVTNDGTLEQLRFTRRPCNIRTFTLTCLVANAQWHYYPHMPISKVWIYRLLFVCFLFVRLRISMPRIKLAASNFAGWFIDVQGKESPILGNFALPEAQNQTNRPACEGQ